jgi:outer membrane protein assembly factor BamB
MRRVAVASLAVAVVLSLELAYTASAVTRPAHFQAPRSIAFVGDNAVVTNTDMLTLFNAVTKKFEYVPPNNWYHLNVPAQVVSFGHYAWVVNEDGTISEYGPDSSHFVRVVTPRKAFLIFGGDLVTYKDSLWYLCQSNDSLIKMNGDSGKVIRRIPLPSQITNPNLFAFVKGHIWVTSLNTNTVVELNRASGRLITSLTTDSKYGTSSLTVNRDDLWIDGGNVVEELNGSSGAVIRQIRARADHLHDGVSITAGGGDIWVLSLVKSSLTELDASNGHLVRVLTKAEGEFSNPNDVVYRDGEVWVVNGASNSVSEIDATNGTLLRSIS